MEMRFSVEWAGISCRGVGGGDVAAVEVIARHHTPQRRLWYRTRMDPPRDGQRPERYRETEKQTDNRTDG